MRKILGALVVAGALSVAVPAVAQAHIFKFDGDMTAELHIRPNDAPVTGEATTYTLTFTERSDTFSLQQCNCAIEFNTGGTMVNRQMLAASSRTLSENTYEFPKAGAYNLHVTGSPKNGGQFAAFTLDYTIRVGKGQPKEDSIPVIAWVGIGVAAVGLVAVANIQNIRKKKGKK